MCGRFDLIKAEQQLEAYYEKSINFTFDTPRYNVSPGQNVPVVTSAGIESMHWGLVPQWAKSINTGYSMINARAETLMEKHTYKNSFLHRRCLIPATGFYEWRVEQGVKVPYHFIVKSRELFSFAGIYLERTMPEDKILKSFSIITTVANDTVGKIHDKHRMPVILDKEEEAIWLDQSADPDELMLILNSYPDKDMDVWQVSQDVNNGRNDNPDLIKPIDN